MQELGIVLQTTRTMGTSLMSPPLTYMAKLGHEQERQHLSHTSDFQLTFGLEDRFVSG